jgi:hypothetical protein
MNVELRCMVRRNRDVDGGRKKAGMFSKPHVITWLAESGFQTTPHCQKGSFRRPVNGFATAKMTKMLLM